MPDTEGRIGDKPSLVHILEELTVFQKVLHGGEICQSPLVMGRCVQANVIQNLERTIPYPNSTLVSHWAWLTTLEEAFQDAKAGISEVQIANQRCPSPKGCTFQEETIKSVILLCIAIGAQRREPRGACLGTCIAWALGVYASCPPPDSLSQTQNWASEVHLLCSFLFFHLPQHQGQKRQSESHGVVRGWTGPWH